MNGDRIAALLDEAISTGTIPETATESERAEVEGLLEAMGVLDAMASTARAEAEASLPPGRARFQRYLAENQPAPAFRAIDAISRPRLLPWGRVVPRGVTMALAGSAAAVALLAVAAVMTWQLAFNSTTSAYAEMAEPGDYVQVEAVIQEAENGQLAVTSAVGDLDVELAGTTVIGGRPERELWGLQPGDRVFVSGVAGQGRRLIAQTLAVREGRAEGAPRVLSFRELRSLEGRLEGTVVSYAAAADGSRGAVLIETAADERYLVPIEGDSVGRLVESASNALGQVVRVVPGSGTASGKFALEVVSESEPGEETALTTVRGVMVDALYGPAPTGGAGLPSATLTVQTLRGLVEVHVRDTARVFLGRSELSPGSAVLKRAVGHAVTVTGSVDPGTGQLVAEVVLVGPKAERRER